MYLNLPGTPKTSMKRITWSAYGNGIKNIANILSENFRKKKCVWDGKVLKVCRVNSMFCSVPIARFVLFFSTFDKGLFLPYGIGIVLTDNDFFFFFFFFFFFVRR